jgi:hypothetical protein
VGESSGGGEPKWVTTFSLADRSLYGEPSAVTHESMNHRVYLSGTRTWTMSCILVTDTMRYITSFHDFAPPNMNPLFNALTFSQLILCDFTFCTLA